MTRLQEMKTQNLAGEVDSKAMNEILLDFMISMIDTKDDVALLNERVQELEEDMERLEKFIPVEEVASEFAVTVGNLYKEDNKTDKVLAGELITALNINLSSNNVEKVLRIGEQLNQDGSVKYPGKLLIELDNKVNKIACLKANAKSNLKNSDQFKNVYLSQALSRAQMTDRFNTKELMQATGLTNYPLNGLGRIVPSDNYEQGGGFGARGGFRGHGDRRSRGDHRGARGTFG